MPATFVMVMEDLFHHEIGKFIWIYIDDIFIFSNSLGEHIEHVQHGCRKLKEHQFYAKPKKSVFFVAKLEILDHIRDDNGIHPAPAKMRNIMDWTRSNNQKELQQLKGLVNYIPRFMPHAATITALLTEVTGDAEWLWKDLQETAFQAVKRAAVNHKLLTQIEYDNPDTIWLFTNASPTGT